MPGWHEATREWREQGRIQTAGIVLEQHPERARLFMQWKQLDWPVMVEPFNVLGLTAVPRTFLLDEHGVLRLVHPRLDALAEVGRDFIDREFAPPTEDASVLDLRPLLDVAPPPEEEATAWRERAMALALWGGESRLDEAFAAAERALTLEGSDRAHFALGVIARMRFDSSLAHRGDFARAAEHWAAALDVGPNNYIWRRRLQQYGPRLDKPYPFYDWVSEAREAIVARGETPAPLRVEPGGAEFAQPASEFAMSEGASEPDAAGRIDRDEQPLVKHELALVPPAAAPGDAVRVHLVLRPDEAAEAHWNNEAGDTTLWLDPPEGWAIDERLLLLENPPEDVSREARSFEFELRAPEDASGAAVLRGYALYFICEDVTGVCLFRRQDFAVDIAVRAADAARLKDGG